MENMINYVNEFGKFTFEEQSFNEVDALVFAQMSYFKWEELDIDIYTKRIPITDAKQYVSILTTGTRVPKNNEDLFNAIINSNRFKSLKIGYFQNILDKELNEQFSAMTIESEDKVINITFRGTDATLIGWREDLELSFTIHTPGQLSAVAYFNWVKQSNKKYRLVGHSKGGNLAAYCGCVIENPTDIIGIYNFDGPSFLPGNLDTNRIYLIHHKYIPQESIIGLLMEENDTYTVMESAGHNFKQHDPFNWVVKGNAFKTMDSVKPISFFIRRNVNGWLLHSSADKRKDLVDILFDLIDNQGKETFHEFTLKDWIAIYNQYKDIDEESKAIVSQLAKLLIDENKRNSKEMIEEYIETKRKINP